MASSRETRLVAGLVAAMSVAGALIWWALHGGDPAAAEGAEASVEASAGAAGDPEGRGSPPVVKRDHEEAADPALEAGQVPDLALPRALPGLKLPPQEPDYGALDTAGELSKTQGARAVAAFYPFAIRCLLETRQKEPHVGSRITLRLRVVPDGAGRTRVLDLDALDKGKTSPTLRACLKRALPNVLLDLGPEARGTVTAPMVLGPDNDPPPAPEDPPQPAGTPQVLPPGETLPPDELDPVPEPGSPPPDLDEEHGGGGTEP